MSEKIIGVVKDISQFLVGTLVSDTEETLTLRNVALLGISNNGPQINIQFIPIDLLSLQPPLGVKNLVKDPTIPLDVVFKKDHLLFHSLELSENVVTNYRNFTLTSGMGAPPVEAAPSIPDQNIVKLF